MAGLICTFSLPVSLTWTSLFPSHFSVLKLFHLGPETTTDSRLHIFLLLLSLDRTNFDTSALCRITCLSSLCGSITLLRRLWFRRSEVVKQKLHSFMLKSPGPWLCCLPLIQILVIDVLRCTIMEQ